jgi:hypothetical protein
MLSEHFQATYLHGSVSAKAAASMATCQGSDQTGETNIHTLIVLQCMLYGNHLRGKLDETEH